MRLGKVQWGTCTMTINDEGGLWKGILALPCVRVFWPGVGSAPLRGWSRVGACQSGGGGGGGVLSESITNV